jgi:hypothetical protein
MDYGIWIKKHASWRMPHGTRHPTHLPHINSHLATLPDHHRRILLDRPLSENLQYPSGGQIGFTSRDLVLGPVGGDPAESLGGFVTDHVFFDWVAENAQEGRNGVGRGELAEDVGDFVAV